MKGKPSKNQVLSILNFARGNHCIVTPIGYGRFAEAYNDVGACPCDTKRKLCPCPEALVEIPRDGHCTCQLFWRDYDSYIKVKLGVCPVS